MADITMCQNVACPKRHSCFRYIAMPNPYWQSYSIFDAENCDYFIDASLCLIHEKMNPKYVDEQYATQHDWEDLYKAIISEKATSTL